MIYLELLIGFLRVGLFSFGGAYAAIPLIREIVLSYGWIDDEMLSDMIAVSESTPGPIMVNLATYIGSSQGGFLGALIATTAVILPAFIIVILIMIALKKLIEKPFMKSIFQSIAPCITGIILATGFYMLLRYCFGNIGAFSFDWIALLLTVILAALYFGSKKIMKRGVSPIILICISAVVSVLVYGWN